MVKYMVGWNMGLVRVRANIGSNRQGLQEIEFLVDTGSFYTFLPLALAAKLGIAFPLTAQVILADSRTVDVPLGVAYLRVNDREGGVLVGAMEVPMPLLGASALEALGLKVNPTEGTLEHSRPCSTLLSVMSGRK